MDENDHPTITKDLSPQVSRTESYGTDVSLLFGSVSNTQTRYDVSRWSVSSARRFLDPFRFEVDVLGVSTISTTGPKDTTSSTDPEDLKLRPL